MSLALQSMAHRLEVVVSDDGSCDSTEQVVEQFARHAPFPVKWVTEPHRGFRLAACRNRGVAQSGARHLLILDGDCLVPPDHVEQHLSAHRPGIVTNTYCVRLERSVSERVTGAEVVSGDYVGWSPRVELQKLRRLQWKSQFYNWLGHPTRPHWRGGNVGITRDDFERVNGFDESFCGWGGEDDDFGLRLRAAGLRIEYILHRTRTYHLWHPPALLDRRGSCRRQHPVSASTRAFGEVCQRRVGASASGFALLRGRLSSRSASDVHISHGAGTAPVDCCGVQA